MRALICPHGEAGCMGSEEDDVCVACRRSWTGWARAHLLQAGQPREIKACVPLVEVAAWLI